MVKQLLVFSAMTQVTQFEKAICNAAQSSCVPVSTSAKSGVFGFADRVMLDRYLSPVVDGLLSTRRRRIHLTVPPHRTVPAVRYNPAGLPITHKSNQDLTSHTASRL